MILRSPTPIESVALGFLPPIESMTVEPAVDKGTPCGVSTLLSTAGIPDGSTCGSSCSSQPPTVDIHCATEIPSLGRYGHVHGESCTLWASAMECVGLCPWCFPDSVLLHISF